MKALTYLLILLFHTLCAFGQAHTIHLPKENTESFWYKWMREEESKVGLEQIEKSPYPFYFRLSGTEGEIVEVWQQNGVFRGRFTKWVKDADNKLIPFERFYSQQYELSATQAASIGQLIKTSGILQLPSEEDIKGWGQGLDGKEIIIEYNLGADYYLKNYWTPSVQHGLAEALLVQKFDNEAHALANSEVVRKAFEVGIPFPCYTTDNGYAVCRVVSMEEYWHHQREVNRYVRQMKKEAQRKISK